MQDFEPAFASLYLDNIAEMRNVPYTEWYSMLDLYPHFRVRHETEGEMGFEQVFHMRDGLILRTIDLQMLRDHRVSIRTLGGYISVFFNLRGSSLLAEVGGEEYANAEGTCGIIYSPDSRFFDVSFRAGVRCIIVQVLIRKSLLQAELFGRSIEGMPQVLSLLYAEERTSLYHSLPIDVEARQALQVLTAMDCTGRLRDRFIEAKSMELICLMMRALLRQERSVDHKPLGARDVELLERVRELLVTDLSAPPSIEKLARQLGEGKDTLLARFKQFYGLSFRNYLLQARMERGKTLLEQRDLKINQVAWQLGYEHACNFATAFKRHYGLTPNAYRRVNSKG